MSYNGSGTFNINTSGQPVVAGTVITATAFNLLTADLATGLTTAMTKDGQTTTTARIPFAQGISSTLVTDATNTTSGSIITAGGVGIAKALYVGTNANVAGTLGVTGVATFSAAPIYSSLTASSAVATDASKGLVSVTNTGTGNNVLATAPTIASANLTTALTLTGASGTNGQVLTSGGSGNAPTWSSPSTTSISNGTSNVTVNSSGGSITATTAGTAAVTIDTSQNVGIGTASPNIGGYGANSRILTVQGVSGSYAIAELSSNSANSDDTFVGRLDFSSDGQAANYKNVASIASALSGSTSTKFGANLQFYTRANNAGSGSPIERMRLDPNGNLLFNSGYGSVATAYGCRAWVNFNGTGTPSIRASGNVSSITDNGTGNYTINFTNALVDANYSVSGIASDVGGTGNRGLVSLYTGVTNPAAGSFRIFTFADTTQTDNAYIYVSVFR